MNYSVDWDGPGEGNRCEDCGDVGYVVKVRPKCCGRLSRGGDCRADCAIPEEYQEPCSCGAGN